MRLNFEEFAAKYAAMSTPELLDAASAYDSLSSAAQAALRAEFARRALDPPIIDGPEMATASARDLVTVRRYRDLSEAIVARSLLEASGISVYLRDENLARLEWQISNFIGGIRLQVEASDAPAALELLAQPIPDSIAFGEELAFHQPLCPRCASIDITFQGASRAVALASLSLLSIPLPLGRETWLCNSCGAHWEEVEEDFPLDP